MLVKAAKSKAAEKAFYEPTGTEVFTTSPQELGKFQARESKKWCRIIKAPRMNEMNATLASFNAHCAVNKEIQAIA